jgi:hypothetical protein
MRYLLCISSETSEKYVPAPHKGSTRRPFNYWWIKRFKNAVRWEVVLDWKSQTGKWRRQLSYHLPHQSQLNTHSSGLLPRMPSLLENPLTFFTNTRHPSQRYHLSFSTKKDYIFTQHSSKHWRGSPFTSSPHHHLVRVGANTSILILIVSILLYFLQASLIAYTIWQFELK